MTDLERLESFFNGREWYDYSTLTLVDSCLRKGMYARFGIHGRILENVVGPGANFGSCVHSALAAYTAGWGRLTEEQRRFMAIRAFAKEYAKYDFAFRMGRRQGTIPTNHTLARGVTILD